MIDSWSGACGDPATGPGYGCRRSACRRSWWHRSADTGDVSALRKLVYMVAAGGLGMWCGGMRVAPGQAGVGQRRLDSGLVERRRGRRQRRERDSDPSSSGQEADYVQQLRHHDHREVLGRYVAEGFGRGKREVVRGRTGHNNILPWKVAMEVFSHRPGRAPGTTWLELAQGRFQISRGRAFVASVGGARASLPRSSSHILPSAPL